MKMIKRKQIKSFFLLPQLVFLTLFFSSPVFALGDNHQETHGSCSPILAKIEGDVSIICNDPVARDLVIKLIGRIERESIDAEANRAYIQAQLKTIESLLYQKANSDNPQKYDDALLQYVEGNSGILKELLSEAKKTKYDQLFSDESGYIPWPQLKSKRRFILSAFVNDASCPDDNGMARSVLKIKIVDDKVSMTIDRNEFKAKLSPDRKVIYASSQHHEEEGLTNISGEARIRADGGIEGEFPWTWVADYNSALKCTGTTVLTSLDR